MIICLLLLDRFSIFHLSFVYNVKLDLLDTKLHFMYHYIRKTNKESILTIVLFPQQHIAHCHPGQMVHLSCVHPVYTNCNKKSMCTYERWDWKYCKSFFSKKNVLCTSKLNQTSNKNNKKIQQRKNTTETGCDISTRPLAQVSVKSVGRVVQIIDHSPVWWVWFSLPRNSLNGEINTVFYIPFCRENP